MISIAELEHQIDLATAQLEDASPRTAASFSEELSNASLEAHVTQLRELLRTKLEQRGREVLELRFRGSLADSGSLPLHILGKLAVSLSSTIGHAAQLIKSGSERKRVPREIEMEINLRLAGLAAGSTRVFIVGDTAPDLFGRSLLEETLKDTFALLNASSSPENLIGAVANVGFRAADALRSFIAIIGKAELSLELNWESPQEEWVTWGADSSALRRLADTLSHLAPEEPQRIPIAGEVVTISAKRPFELRTEDGEEYSVKVPDVLTEDVRRLSVGQEVQATLEKQTVRNKITGQDKTTFMLVSVTPL